MRRSRQPSSSMSGHDRPVASRHSRSTWPSPTSTGTADLIWSRQMQGPTTPRYCSTPRETASDQPDRPAPDRRNRPHRSDRTDRRNRPGRADRGDWTGRTPDRAATVERAGRPGLVSPQPALCPDQVPGSIPAALRRAGHRAQPTERRQGHDLDAQDPGRWKQVSATVAQGPPCIPCPCGPALAAGGSKGFSQTAPHPAGRSRATDRNASPPGSLTGITATPVA